MNTDTGVSPRKEEYCKVVSLTVPYPEFRNKKAQLYKFVLPETFTEHAAFGLSNLVINPWERTETPNVFSEYATAREEDIEKEEVNRQIEALFEAGKEEVFEDGMESEFSRNLINLIEKHGVVAVEAIADLIISERANADVASEALRWLGWMDDSRTYTLRLWLLARSLSCSSARVRDGAALGLSFLDDPWAIPSLIKAITQEKIEVFRRYMKQILVQLESTYQCRLF